MVFILVHFILMLFMWVFDDESGPEKILWFFQIWLLLNVAYMCRQMTYQYILFLDAVFGLIAIQLIFQFVGLYTVKYEDQTDLIRYHTTAGDSNFSGLFLALYLVLRSAIVDTKFIYKSIVISILFVGVVLSGSRGALLLLVVPFLRELSFSKLIIATIIVAMAVQFFDIPIVDRIKESLTTGDVFTGRTYRVIKALNELSSIGLFGKGFGIVPFHFTDIRFILSPHNTYLGFLLQGGLFGGIALFLIIIKFYRLIKFVKGGVLLFIIIAVINFNTELYWLNPYFVTTVFVMFSMFVEYEKNIGRG